VRDRTLSPPSIAAFCLIVLVLMSPRAAGQAPAREPQPPVIPGLVANAPASQLRDALQLFGQFAGDWVTEIRAFPEGAKDEVTATGEVHFGWILDGTAIQDVWTFHVKNPPPGSPSYTSGTTLRLYEPKSRNWRCVWISPRKPTVQLLTARAEGDGIVLETQTAEGYPERWIYSDITPTSFRWHAEESHDVGRTWRTTEIITAKRTIAAR